MFVCFLHVYFRTVSGHDCSNVLTGTGKTGTGLRGIRGPKVELQPQHNNSPGADKLLSGHTLHSGCKHEQYELTMEDVGLI